MRIGFKLFFWIAIHLPLYAQPVADFDLPSVACIAESIAATNMSMNAVSYEWDACQGDLNLTPIGSVAGIVTGSSVPTGVDVVYDGTNWFGFVTSRSTNSIIRFSLGENISTVSDVADLGNSSSLLSSPTDIKIITENGKWYGFVLNEGANVLCRLDFGTSLINVPTATVLLNSASGTGNQGLDVIHNGTNWHVIYTFNSKVGVVRLPTIEEIPSVSDQLLTDNLTDNPSLGDIKIIQEQGSIYAYTPSFSSNRLYKLSFGSDLLAVPTETDISSSLIASLNYYGIDGGYDAGSYYLLLSTLQGALVRIDLGSNLLLPPNQSQNLGSLGVFSNTVKNRLIKQKTTWFNFGIDYSSGNFFKAVFPSPQCSMDPGFYESQEIELTFNEQGKKYISLRAFNNGAYDDVHKSIDISPQLAPDIDFTNAQVCQENPIQFFFTTNQEIVSRQWDFGDGQISLEETPQISYSSTGEYDVKLDVVSANGCLNNISKRIKLYSSPVADFLMPNDLICTNNQINFTNTTNDDFDNWLTYQWFVDDELASIERDLQYSFETTGIKTLRLQVSIPGCINELVQLTPDIQAGPIVDFAFLGKCLNSVTQFTTNISEPVTSQTWDFNDGNTSTDANPINVFVTAGEYSVSLLATSTNGCNNSVTKPVIIYSLPVVDFSILAPPLSCTGTSTQFSNLTADPPDGTIISWLWNFDDATATENTSSLQDPSHTFANAGSYDVTLTATTGEGCSGTLQKAIAIEQSPSAVVENSVACKSLPVNFTATGTDLQSYYWEIGTSYYTDANPTHTFSVPGDYQILLTIQGNNNCETIYERFVSVPVPLEPDFSVLKNCVDHQTEFTDITMGADPVAQQEWNFGGMATATGSPVVHSFNSLGSKSITLNVTGESGCSYSVSRTIDIAQAPTASFDASPEAGAMPLVVRFTNNSAEATQHEWTFGDEAQGTSNEVSPSYTFQTTGEFLTELKASNSEGCESTATKLITVVAPLPDVDIRRINVSENPDGSMQLIITLENKGNTFLENLPVDVDISGKVALREVIEESIAPASMYNLVLSYSLTQLSGLSFLCASTTLANDLVPEGNQICIELDDKVFLFSPYPNPVKNDLELTWIAPAEETVTFTLVDAFGKTVLSSSLPSTPGLNRTVYDVTHLGSGIYILTLKAGSASKTQRIVISREN